MTSKFEKEKQKLVQEKCQNILTELLRDEDNKYCVDCDAKGPRWASWNLGIFLCIRCAGIHRNLGVHISKVKSVNLDAWTPEQVGQIQQMGNSKARAVYEANLPDNFRRPQTDSNLESFIRAKYEQKKYIAKEWVPPKVQPAFDIDEELRKEKEKKRSKAKLTQNNLEVQPNSPLPRPQSTPAGTVINADKIPQDVKSSEGKSEKSYVDLLGLDDFMCNNNNNNNIGSVDGGQLIGVSANSNQSSLVNVNEEKSNTQNDTQKDDESDFFNQKAPSEDKKVFSKESILSLYGTNNSSNSFVNPIGSATQNNFMNQPQNNLLNQQNPFGNQQNPFGNQPVDLLQQNSFPNLQQNSFINPQQNSFVNQQQTNFLNQQNNFFNQQQNSFINPQAYGVGVGVGVGPGIQPQQTANLLYQGVTPVQLSQQPLFPATTNPFLSTPSSSAILQNLDFLPK